MLLFQFGVRCVSTSQERNINEGGSTVSSRVPMSCQVIDVHDCRSPLVQGGLDIPIRVTVTMDLRESNIQVMEKYEDLVNECYKEPVNGVFNNVTTSVLEALISDDGESDTESGAEQETKEGVGE